MVLQATNYGSSQTEYALQVKDVEINPVLEELETWLQRQPIHCHLTIAIHLVALDLAHVPTHQFEIGILLRLFGTLFAAGITLIFIAEDAGNRVLTAREGRHNP
jgi:hypothetical protein